MLQTLLTIAIPTFNRSPFLGQTLRQLFSELNSTESSLVEIIVSDNASTDDTEIVVKQLIASGYNIDYVRNEQNVGPDINFANCFQMAKGKYVLLLGDDDFLIDGSLNQIVSTLQAYEPGVLCIKPYGFSQGDDFKQRLPSKKGNQELFNNAGDFLATIGDLMTLVSCCVVNKSLIKHIKPHDFCNTNLVHVNLVLYAALAAKSNVYMNQYLVACTRNNGGGYNFFAAFVTNLSNILDKFEDSGLTQSARRKINRHLIVSYYPYYLLRNRLAGASNLSEISERFEAKYSGFLYMVWIKPTLILPKILAIFWGVSTTVVGRLLYGDADKLTGYFKTKIKFLLRK